VNYKNDQDVDLMRQSLDSKNVTVGFYNPITNPVPNFNQNPCIARERAKALGMYSSQSRPHLTQAAANILS